MLQCPLTGLLEARRIYVLLPIYIIYEALITPSTLRLLDFHFLLCHVVNRLHDAVLYLLCCEFQCIYLYSMSERCFEVLLGEVADLLDSRMAVPGVSSSR